MQASGVTKLEYLEYLIRLNSTHEQESSVSRVSNSHITFETFSTTLVLILTQVGV